MRPSIDPSAIGVGGKRVRPRLAQEVDGAGACVVREDLPRPLHAGERERLRLHLVAAVADVGEPALLVGGERDGDGRGERRDEHREDEGGAALAGTWHRHRSVKRRSMRAPSSSVSVIFTARGRSSSPSSGQRSRHSPGAREVLEVEAGDAAHQRIDGRI